MKAEKLGYTVAEFCHAVGLGKSKVYELIAEGSVQTVKCGSRTLVTTLPRDFLDGLRAEARAA